MFRRRRPRRSRFRLLRRAAILAAAASGAYAWRNRKLTQNDPPPKRP